MQKSPIIVDDRINGIIEVLEQMKKDKKGVFVFLATFDGIDGEKMFMTEQVGSAIEQVGMLEIASSRTKAALLHKVF